MKKKNKNKNKMPLYFNFPRDVRSSNVYTRNCVVQKRKLYANGMQIYPKNTAVILNAYFD